MAAPATDARFLACLNETLKWEGGYSNDKYDPGGATYHGIIQREYDAYRARKGLPKQDVRLMSEAEQDEIYAHSYWDEVRADELPPGVDLVVFDSGVLCGPQRAVKFMQNALGVAADGRIGQITLDAIAAEDPDTLVEKTIANRRAYLKSLPTFWRFGAGWMTRCDGIEHQGLAWAGSPAVAPDAVNPHVAHDDADVQAAGQGRANVMPPSHPIQTPEGKAAAVSTTSGAVGTVLTVGHAANAAHASGGFDILGFLITLSTNEVFVSSALLMVTGIVAWRNRGLLIKREST